MYYDERQEYLNVKKEQYANLPEDEKSIESRKTILRQEMSDNWSRAQHASDAKRSSNIRILILIAIIIGLGYFILYGLDDIDTVVEKMWK